ncbi:MAG: hydrogenase expression/formation protein HypE [Deltaproteobacteria bacterium]|nr:hydrogenase expression/formation protein HypE [Deltaproteobacteria bacterium]
MKSDLILLGHGSGGKLSHQLLDEIIIPTLSGISQKNQNDAAVLPFSGDRLAFTTDSYVVDPVFFPGGNIGDLAINGTVNDLVMSGARPLAISVGLILEEGLSIKELRFIVESMRDAALAANVSIVTGDTKVVTRGAADKIFINTSGIGVFEHSLKIEGNRAKPGDKVIINGTIGDHGIAVLASREGLELGVDILSDSAPLNGLVLDAIEKYGEHIHALRDPTRGGVATTLKEIALQSGIDIELEEATLPVRESVEGACSILGLDPLYVANEGKVLFVVDGGMADDILHLLRQHPFGREAAIIGQVVQAQKSEGRVSLHTAIGGRRIVDMLSGEQLPRIC